jgi:hypothetical protein
MSEKFTSSTRRKDYVAHIAVMLLVLIIVFEVLLVAWLPRKLSSEKLWDRQVSLQEMIDLEDFLRRYIRGDVKYRNAWQEGEGFLGLHALDILAKYIRENRDKMTREQIQEVYVLLQKFQNHYNDWNNHKFYITFEKIKIEPILNRQLEQFQKWEASHDTSAKIGYIEKDN